MRLLALLALAVISAADPASAEPRPEVVRQVSAASREWGDTWAGYAVDGQAGEWFAVNEATGIAPEPRARLAIGSNTKSFTALLVAQAVENGRLLPRGYETELQEIAPSLGVQAARRLHRRLRTVAISNLLTHTGGIPGQDSGYHRVATRRPELLLELFGLDPGREPRTGPVRFPPAYSDDGYALLGAILENLSGRAWRRMIAEDIYAPLGMWRCGFISTRYEPEVIDPAAAVQCPMEDWLKYLRFQSDAAAGDDHGAGILRSREAYSRLTAILPGWGVGRTLGGWQRDEDRRGFPYVYHFGGDGGFVSVSLVDVEPGPTGHRLTVAVVARADADEDIWGRLLELARSMRDALR